MRTVLRKILKSGESTKEERVVVCDICGDIWPLYEHKPVNWLDYQGKIQCLKHCPDAVKLTAKSDNILRQLLLYYNYEPKKVIYKGVCPQCGTEFIKNHKEQITCGNSCSNRFFRMGANNFKHKKRLTDEELKDIEEFKKNLGDIT